MEGKVEGGEKSLMKEGVEEEEEGGCEWSSTAWMILKKVRETSPLIQCITNFVSMDLMANTLLAAGASPAMIHSLQEISDFTPHIQALCINLGTLSPEWLPSMISAATLANKLGKPWVLDPVAVSASDYRFKACLSLINLHPTVVRGNASEILALANASSTTTATSSSQTTTDKKRSDYLCLLLSKWKTGVFCYGSKSLPWISMTMSTHIEKRKDVRYLESGMLLETEHVILKVKSLLSPDSLVSIQNQQSLGTDSSHGSMDAVEAAKSLAISSGAVVAVSGAVDIITDGERLVGARNGVAMLQKITATGCSVTALIAAFVAVDPSHAFEATASALSVFGVASEMGMDIAKGPASLRMHLIDSLHGLDQDTVLSRVHIGNIPSRA